MQSPSTISRALDVDRPRLAARDFVALTKPRITTMVLVTTGGGLWLAPAKVSPLTVALTLLGTALVVGGANTLNMVLERDIDGLMKRTKDRPLPARRMSPTVALWFGVALSVTAIPVLAFGVNATTALLALLANLLYVLAYTPLKQRSHWALQVGAVPGAIPPLLGWTAATGKVDAGGLVLFAILFLWQVPHFHAIALFRKLEYKRAGLVVLPNVEGDDAARHSIVRYVGALLCVSVLLVPLHVSHGLYLVLAVLLGGGLLATGLAGLRRNADLKSARLVFLASLVYLVGLFSAIVADALTGGIFG